MELRRLKYFLAVARELVELEEKALEELRHREDVLSGDISIGCGEARNMAVVARAMDQFRQEHPLVRFHLYSATADDIGDRLQKGLLDLGLVTEPVETDRFACLRLPLRERYGLLVRADSPLAQKETLGPGDLVGTPLLMARRESVRSQQGRWFGEYWDRLTWAGTFNLVMNAASAVRQGMAAAICFDLEADYSGLKFLPLDPPLETGAVLIWKKDQPCTQALTLFLQTLKNTNFKYLNI